MTLDVQASPSSRNCARIRGRLGPHYPRARHDSAITKTIVEYATLFPALYITAETARVVQAENIHITAATGKSGILVVELAPGRTYSAALGGLYAAGMWVIGADGHQLSSLELRAACRGDERVTFQIKRRSPLQPPSNS